MSNPKPEPVIAWCAVGPGEKLVPHAAFCIIKDNAEHELREHIRGPGIECWRLVRVRIEVVDE